MFKKIAVVVLVCVFLAACGGSSGEPDIGQVKKLSSSPLRFQCEYTVGDHQGAFVFVRSSGSVCEVEYLLPESIAGMRLALENGVVVNAFNDIRHEVAYSDMPNENPVKALNSLFDRLLQAVNSPEPLFETATNINGEDVFKDAGGTLLAFLDGVPTRIEIPSLGMEFRITEFEYLGTAAEQPSEVIFQYYDPLPD